MKNQSAAILCHSNLSSKRLHHQWQWCATLHSYSRTTNLKGVKQRKQCCEPATFDRTSPGAYMSYRPMRKKTKHWHETNAIKLC